MAPKHGGSWDDLRRYPRTPHLAGSRLQPGDTDNDQVALDGLIAGEQVWEEKIDGSNTAISFTLDGDLKLQSRGHYLNGGWQEKQYNLLKRWANHHIDWLFDTLGWRYIMYGEWCYAKHTVFYDRLAHYFLEFDIYDRQEDCFLDTTSRHALLRGKGYAPIISVPVVHTGAFASEKMMRGLIRHSLYKSDVWPVVLATMAKAHAIDVEQARRETDQSSMSEGLYLKVEQAGRVVGRYKFVRPDFLQSILDSGSHWATRTILPNQLVDGVDIWRLGDKS